MPYPAYNYNFNPYMQQSAQNYFNMQQQVPQMQQMNNQIQNNTSLSGKIVDSMEVVKVTDVPMDGNFYYFPKADGTEIYTKRWLQNGTTEILTFMKDNVVQETAEENKVNFELLENSIIERLNSIDDRIGKLEKGLNSTSRSTTKKEA